MDRPIRAALETVLSGLPLTGSRVYTSRVRPLPADHQPTLLIYTTGERAERSGMGSALYLRRVETVIEGVVTLAGVPDDLLSDIAADVEAAVVGGMSGPLGDVCHAATYLGRQYQIDGDAQRHVGRVRLEFEILTRSSASAPQTFVR